MQRLPELLNKYLKPLLLLIKHFVSFLVLFDKFAPQVVVFPFQFFLSLLADPGPLLQIFDLPLFKGDGFLQRNKLSL